MAVEAKKYERKRPKISLSIDAAIEARLVELSEKSNMSKSAVAEKCLALGFAKFETLYIPKQVEAVNKNVVSESLNDKAWRRILLYGTEKDGWSPY
jgi:hypothetical protein